MPRMPLADGATFAGFTIVRLLGSGSTGGVYLAEHPRIPRRVALKILRADVSADPEFRDRFSRDANLATTLDHPNIVRVLDLGESGRRLWLARELVDGRDASRILRKHFSTGFPPHDVSMIVDRIAQALDFAHPRGLLHRHVAPTNILLANTQSYADGVQLTDFGTARRLDNLGDVTSSTMPVGLLGYAAPEQLTGGRVDGRTDQFGLAATAFHLLTGVPPFSDCCRDSAPPELAAIHPHLAGMDSVITNGLAVDPAARYDTCRDFAAALTETRAARTSPTSAGTSPSPPAAPGTNTARADPATTHFASPPVVEAPESESPPHTDIPGVTSTAVRKPKPSTRYRLVALVLALVAVVIFAVAGIAYFGTRRAPAPSPNQPAAAPASVPVNAPRNVVPQPPVCGDPVALAAGLSRRDKLAQLLMVGVTGAEDARAVVGNFHVGGIFIGSWTDLSILDGPLREIAASAGPLALAVSVDEEGGRVERLAGIIGSQPSPRELAANYTPKQVQDIAFSRGTKMRALGITVDFAPVVDVTDAPDDTVIGDRSFGSDPRTVIDYAGAYAQGLRDAGLLPVLKHFPGHGHGSGDSHKSGVTTPPLQSLQNDDLIPYRTLTKETPVGVMVGHLQVPELTATTPASLSPEAYRLLRSGNYGGPPFTGPVFTDDLSSMAAINQRWGVADAVLLALKAGADTALWISTDQIPTVLDRLEQAVNVGELTMARVNDALERVATAKGPNPTCRG